MKEFFRITSVLTIFCGLCAFLLSYVSTMTSQRIALNDKKRIEQSILRLAPDMKEAKKIDLIDSEVYKLYDKNAQLIYYAFLAQGDGYQGKIKLLAIIDPDLKTLGGIEVIDLVETPGLGARIQEDFFKDQFKKLNILPLIEYIKDKALKDNQIVTISGATISSKAVVNILNQRINSIRKQKDKL